LGPSSVIEGPGFHIRGAKTEFAASLRLNMYWRPTIGKTDEPDVGGLVEVRSSDLRYGRLIVKPRSEKKPNEKNYPYVLALMLGEDFYFPGWIWADDARARYKLTKDYGDPAHFVPQCDLLDLNLIEAIRSASLNQV
jgi:hypothetical protein